MIVDDVVITGSVEERLALYVVLNGFVMKNNIVDVSCKYFTITRTDNTTLVITFTSDSRQVIIHESNLVNFWLKLKMIVAELQFELIAEKVHELLAPAISSTLNVQTKERRFVIPSDDTQAETSSDKSEDVPDVPIEQPTSKLSAIFLSDDVPDIETMKQIVEQIAKSLLNVEPDKITTGGAFSMSLKKLYDYITNGDEEQAKQFYKKVKQIAQVQKLTDDIIKVLNEVK